MMLHAHTSVQASDPVIHAPALHSSNRDAARLSWQNAAVGAYMALVPMFLGYLLFGYGLTKIPSSTATTVTLTEPAVATLLAVLIVGERLDAVGWAGIATIGVVLIVLALAPGASPRSRR